LVAQLAGLIANTDKLPAQSNRLVEELKFDSFDEIEFHIFLEDEFGIDFSDEGPSSEKFCSRRLAPNAL
jgi:acyl carrier protein